MNTSKQVNVMVLLVFLAVIITGLYTLWDPDRAEEAQDEQLEGTIRRGAYLFSANCRTCHGDAGEGGAASNRLRAAPALNRPDLQGLSEDGIRDEVAYAIDYKFVYYTITCGRVGKLMPAWAQSQGGTLNEEQIKQLTTFILDGDGEHPPPTAPTDGADGEGEGEEPAEAEEEEQKPWELAKEFAQRGVEEFHIEGDAQYELELAAPVSETDTELTLNHVMSEGAQVIFPGERLSISDESGATVEIFVIAEDGVNLDANTVTVERGVGTTSAVAHEAGAEVLKPPVPPEGQIVQQSCGQIAGSQVVVPPEAPSTTLSITASGTAWNKTTLSATADAPLTITVQNNDEGTVHNWHVFEGAEPGGESVAETELESGIVTQTLEFGPLDAGEYYYVCDVHTQMEGVLTSYAPGTGPEGAATPGAAGTPDAGAGTTVAESTPAATETPTP